MKNLKITSEGIWYNTHIFMNDEDISKVIEKITIKVMVGEYVGIEVKLKGIKHSKIYILPKFELTAKYEESYFFIKDSRLKNCMAWFKRLFK